MVKVLFAAAEAAPFIKTGGLGDVIGSLPKELNRQGADVRVIIPKYSLIPLELAAKMSKVASFTVPVGWRKQSCGLFKAEHDGVIWYFIDNEYYFRREDVYGFYDEAERYAYFTRAVLEALPYMDFTPDIVHCHDWHTGPLAAMLKTQYKMQDGYAAIKTVFTIHNLMYQGIFPSEILGDILALPQSTFTLDGLEFYGQVSYMKGGLCYSDCLSTVSKSYAKEIQEPYFGEKLEGLLQKRSSDLCGIINGIDYDIYNPETDDEIHVNYSYKDIGSRAENKVKLQEVLGLPAKEDAVLVGIVSRLVSSKGLDLIAHVMEEILSQNVQLVVLGTGEAQYESMFAHAAVRYPDKVSANITFSDSLARKIYAGSDIFLMPSRFEPCGIGQLIALRYGSIPVVREVGGLKDTVIPFNEVTGLGNGFNFKNYNAHEMLYCLEKAIRVSRDKTQWETLIKNAMMADNSWQRSAKEYRRLYETLIEN